METTLGGNRLGAGKKEKIYLKDYERSTHDLSYIWRSTMASGTLVPFMGEVSLPGDSFEINLECDILTHPTIGPLFGSYKVQLDVFTIPIRLYNAGLHMNMLNIGMKMQEVYLPQVKLVGPALKYGMDLDNAQIHTSCIMSYLDIRGIGQALAIEPWTGFVEKEVNALKWLAYWDIYKNYYANKQEEIGMVIHNNLEPMTWAIHKVYWKPDSHYGELQIFAVADGSPVNTVIRPESTCRIEVTGDLEETDMTRFSIWRGGPEGQAIEVSIEDLFTSIEYDVPNNMIRCSGCTVPTGGYTIIGGYQMDEMPNYQGVPKIAQFPLKNIDDMRLNILQHDIAVPFVMNYANTSAPYKLMLKTLEDQDRIMTSLQSNQEGLGLKTYQSDLFNNWLDTEWIDGADGINNITKINVTDGAITVNEILLAKKVYDMLNRIAVSGGSYDDWLDATYTHERIKNIENPIYMGGLSKELIFQEIISTSETADNPLGTLAGRGRLSNKNKGGYVKIKTDEPSYIMGIVSLTPRIDYSQGNKWDTNLKNMNDFHKPALDGIGFQDLLTDKMAYWDSVGENDGNWFYRSAGKQPAWINYMSNVNVVRGNFATATEQMYMTLNRKYEAKWEDTYQVQIKDLTTYIDPSKFNNIFADTRLDAQNFWTQIKVGITARRKMSAKVIPNL